MCQYVQLIPLSCEINQLISELHGCFVRLPLVRKLSKHRKVGRGLGPTLSKGWFLSPRQAREAGYTSLTMVGRRE